MQTTNIGETSNSKGPIEPVEMIGGIFWAMIKLAHERQKALTALTTGVTRNMKRRGMLG